MPETSLGFQYPWKEVNIGSVADVDVGGTPSTAIPSFWGGNVPWMSSGEVHQRRIYDVQGRITELGLRSSNAKLIDPPAVAIALAGQGKTRGTAALTLVRLCTNQSVALIKGRSGTLDTVFFFHILDSRYEELRMRSSGGGRGGLSKAIIEAIPIALPEIDEQQKIAQILDTIDNLITLTDRHIAKLKLAKAGLLHDLLTRGIDENGELRDPIAHPEQFKETGTAIGRIPKDWEIQPFRRYTLSSAFGPRFSSDFYNENGNVAILRTTDMDEEGNLNLSTMPLAKLNIERFREHCLEVNDIIITRSGTCGVTSVFTGFFLPVIPGAFSIRFRLNQELLPELARQYFNWHVGRARVLRDAEGGVQKNLKGSTLLQLLLPIPKIDEQHQILYKLESLTTQISHQQTRLSKFKLLKKGLMSDLLTGRVRVNLDSLEEG